MEYSCDENPRSASKNGNLSPMLYEETEEDLLTLEVREFMAACRGHIDALSNDGKHGLKVVKLLYDVQAMLIAP